ncbi:TPA: methyltransferase domain-containing protein [Burkholderia cepacia ATCC 25416]|uniref:methyltransferase domain-containing protein n=1 Tax=Burkholderia cepacia TaxID=292 RepID=UPI001639D236|nr:methyltransferase domain-containing protein [Burkholderia cepacia]HDR9765351.1 methyltransferase domain-containing protein [Burkholderia cepacia ATCC 25416]HDR9772740.1 methyltransferase domain-containing protein [Burkholderia cepacia ATCC 25416]HDR9781261.1 methyltransferase domain-containing protein [Burkholderia cepacia ATCC 25416]HDR9789253.1 methyltransferase domain-containing protein [Burkholderia cepacia ATCC 25416]
MHDTAYVIGGLVMSTYLPSSSARILEIGAQNVNGTLRDHAPRNAEYVGLDFEAGDGVDVVVTGLRDWNVPEAHFDLVMASSVFEHDKAFWRTFIEMCRRTKPGGHIYISAPSNGLVHRFPKDYWRFYPDSGLALEELAREEGFDITLIESFVAEREADLWNDFCAVFRRGPCDTDLNRDFVHGKIRCTNAINWRSSLIVNAVNDSEDMRLLGLAREDMRRTTEHNQFLESQIDELKVRNNATEGRLYDQTRLTEQQLGQLQALGDEVAREQERRRFLEVQLSELAVQKAESDERLQGQIELNEQKSTLLQALGEQLVTEQNNSAEFRRSFEVQLSEMATQKSVSEERLQMQVTLNEQQSRQLQTLSDGFAMEQTNSAELRRSIDALLSELAVQRAASDERLQAQADLNEQQSGQIQALLEELATERASSEELRRSVEVQLSAVTASKPTQKEVGKEHLRSQTELGKGRGETLPMLAVESPREVVEVVAPQYAFEEKLGEFTSQKSEVEKRLRERFREIAGLTRVIQERDQQLSDLRMQMQHQMDVCDERGRQLQALAAELAQEKANSNALQRSLEANIFELSAAKASSDERLQERFRETAHLTRMIQERDRRISEVQTQIEWLCRVVSVLTKGFSTSSKARAMAWLPTYFSQKAQKACLKEHGLFDSDDYVETYPDVLRANTDPLRHYINHGIKEGRVIKSER